MQTWTSNITPCFKMSMWWCSSALDFLWHSSRGTHGVHYHTPSLLMHWSSSFIPCFRDSGIAFFMATGKQSTSRSMKSHLQLLRTRSPPCSLPLEVYWAKLVPLNSSSWACSGLLVTLWMKTSSIISSNASTQEEVWPSTRLELTLGWQFPSSYAENFMSLKRLKLL